jgi:hypothetical protein
MGCEVANRTIIELASPPIPPFRSHSYSGLFSFSHSVLFLLPSLFPAPGSVMGACPFGHLISLVIQAVARHHANKARRDRRASILNQRPNIDLPSQRNYIPLSRTSVCQRESRLVFLLRTFVCTIEVSVLIMRAGNHEWDLSCAKSDNTHPED